MSSPIVHRNGTGETVNLGSAKIENALSVIETDYSVTLSICLTHASRRVSANDDHESRSYENEKAN